MALYTMQLRQNRMSGSCWVSSGRRRFDRRRHMSNSPGFWWPEPKTCGRGRGFLDVDSVSILSPIKAAAIVKRPFVRRLFSGTTTMRDVRSSFGGVGKGQLLERFCIPFYGIFKNGIFIRQG